MCKINPRVDFAFKKLFGSEENKDLLISLINAIVSEQEQVVEVELKNPYNLADYRAGKMSILDIKAKSESGRWFNVEMQISEDYNFDKRAIYYWAKLVTEQLSEGKMYKELKKTISINILDFNFIPNTQEVHNCYKIINTATGKDDKLHDIFELHYVELKKFTKQTNQVTSALDRWSTFLTRAHELDKYHIADELASDVVIDIATILEVTSLTESVIQALMINKNISFDRFDDSNVKITLTTKYEHDTKSSTHYGHHRPRRLLSRRVFARKRLHRARH